MPAFAGAVALGYRYVETDVHVTSDGVLVAFHDDKLDRVTNHHGLIRERTWREVADARVDGIEPILRFDDLLTTFPTLRVNVDPKHGSSIEPLIHMIEASGVIDRICVGSFSDSRIARCREALGSALCTSLGPRAVTRLRSASLRLPGGSFDAGCVQVPPSLGAVPLVDAAFVEASHVRGMQVHVWTIDEPDQMQALLDLGVDGIMTDQPAVLKQVLMSRKAWCE